MPSSLPRFALSLALVSVMGASALVIVPTVRAQANASAQQGPRALTLPASGTIKLTVRGFSLDYGSPLPNVEMRAMGPADRVVRDALNYAVQSGYTENAPEQTELAIWYVRDKTWRAQEHTVAQEIVDNATPVNDPGEPSAAISLADATAARLVSVTARFVPQTEAGFYGDGEATIKNLSARNLEIYVNIGLAFSTEQETGFPGLVAYETGTDLDTESNPLAMSEPALPIVSKEQAVQNVPRAASGVINPELANAISTLSRTGLSQTSRNHQPSSGNQAEPQSDGALLVLTLVGIGGALLLTIGAMLKR